MYAYALFWNTEGNIKPWDFASLSNERKAMLIAFLEKYAKEQQQ